jgi:rhodanese-related sulfurtransferase
MMNRKTSIAANGVRDCVRHCAVFLVLTPLWSGLWAQQQGSGVPRALKDVPRSNELACSQESAAGESGPGVDRMGPKPDYSCAVTAAEALALIRSNSAVLVDSRLPSEFARYRIDGALNADPRTLVVRQQWKARAIVLLDDGSADSETYASCAYLRSRGFRNVRVVKGGLHAWAAAGLPLIGDVPQATRLQEVDEAAVHRRQASADTLVLLAPSMFRLIDVLPTAQLLGDATPDSIRKAVIDRRRQAVPLHAVVYIGPSSDLEPLAEWISPQRFLVYPGSEGSLRSYSVSLNKSWQRRAQGPAQIPCQLL